MLRAEVEVDLGPLHAERLELEGAGALEAVAVGARKVADSLPVDADRDHIDDVLHPIIVKVEAGLAPGAEIVRDLRFHLPALRRHEIGVAGVGAILVQAGLGEKVREIDLPDAAAELEADVPRFRGMPTDVDTAFRTEELARSEVVADEVEARELGAGRDLQVDVWSERTAQR